MADASRFFEYARERHQIYLRRAAGEPRSQWTADPILKQYRFCNIFRELDTTTQHLRKITSEIGDRPEVLLATVVYRWFNRMQTCDAIFHQLDTDGETAWTNFLATRRTDKIKSSVLAFCGKGPYTTGSYIIKTPDGMNKLDGVLWLIRTFNTHGASLKMGQILAHTPHTLENVWKWLKESPGLGDFMAYEIVTDLRHTYLLRDATDIMTWANPGPGAMRGLNRMYDRPLDKRYPKSHYIEEMRVLLDESRDSGNWPSEWPVWEMRDVEHTLCEYFKYTRGQDGQPASRQRFNPV
jgi:hypothetical protein